MILEEKVIQDIKEYILEQIRQLYKKEYTGKLWISKLNPIGYQIKFGMNNDDKPLVISAELEYCDFLKFMRKELRDRGMDLVKYFIGVKTYPDQGQNKC